LAWSDEFDGNTLDSTKWNARNQDGNAGNGDLQYYLPSQVAVANGTLTIATTNTPYQTRNYSSGWIDTQNIFSTTYARYEFRAQLPGGINGTTGYGLWSSLWLMSEFYCWPSGAEFDIAEYRGEYANIVTAALHYAAWPPTTCPMPQHSNGISYTDQNVSSFGLDYHVFALEWWEQNATWYVDDYPIMTVPASTLQTGGIGFDPSPHYIIINTALGGYGGTPTLNTVFPAYLNVDYVRVYVYRASCEDDACSQHGTCSLATFLCACNEGWSGSSCEFNTANTTGTTGTGGTTGIGGTTGTTGGAAVTTATSSAGSVITSLFVVTFSVVSLL